MKVPENEDFENAVDEELSFQALLKKAEGHIKQGTYLKKEENNNHRAIKELSIKLGNSLFFHLGACIILQRHVRA